MALPAPSFVRAVVIAAGLLLLLAALVAVPGSMLSPAAGFLSTRRLGSAAPPPVSAAGQARASGVPGDAVAGSISSAVAPPASAAGTATASGPPGDAVAGSDSSSSSGLAGSQAGPPADVAAGPSGSSSTDLGGSHASRASSPGASQVEVATEVLPAASGGDDSDEAADEEDHREPAATESPIDAEVLDHVLPFIGAEATDDDEEDEDDVADDEHVGELIGNETSDIDLEATDDDVEDEDEDDVASSIDLEATDDEADDDGMADANVTLVPLSLVQSGPPRYPAVTADVADILTPCGRTLASTGPCERWQIRSGKWCYDVYRSNRKRASLPIVISAPHDGRSVPAGSGWAKRTSKLCTTTKKGKPVRVACKFLPDTYSAEVAIRVAKQLHSITGRYPHVLVACISRSKVDFNRVEQEAAFGSSKSKEAYQMYFKKARSMVRKVKKQCGPGFWLDLHGWRPPASTLSYTQLGYGISRSQVDSAAREQVYQRSSSLRPLAGILSKCDLIKGHHSLGAFLTSKLVPGYSPALPSPKALPRDLKGGAAYLQALYDGYTAKYIAALGMASVQVEMPTKVRCKGPKGCAVRSPAVEAGWTPYAVRLAKGLHGFMSKNYGDVYKATCGSPTKQGKQKTYMAKRNTAVCR